MGLTAKSTGGSFDPVPEDIHRAICYGVVDLGTHHNPMFDNHTHKILLIFELPEQRIEIEDEDKPRAISKEYTLSLHEKSNLRKHLESWRGKKFSEEECEGWDLEKLLTVQAKLQVMHQKSKKSGNLYATIENIIPVEGKVKKTTPENPTLFFSFENGNTTLPDNMPEWIQHKIEESLEWKSFTRSKNGQSVEEQLELEPVEDKDDIPF
jgi:hypothetical protein